MDLGNQSILYLVGEDSEKCGYCGKSESTSYYIQNISISPAVYESFMLYGWRRCSNIMYQMLKPSCCYTRALVLHVDDFEPNRSQRRVLHTFERYLNGEFDIVHGRKVFHEQSKERQREARPCLSADERKELQNGIAAALRQQQLHVDPSAIRICTMERNKRVIHSSPVLLSPQCASVDVEVLRKDLSQCTSSPFAIENRHINFITDMPATPAMPPTPPSPSKPVHTKRTCRLELITPDKDDDDVFALYARYEKAVFGKTRTRDAFFAFLGDSSLTPVDDMGTFWLKWVVDDRLIAVSVLDVLPSTVSSVYFFYDPELRPLSLGILSAVREIEFAKRIGRSQYSLGLYIQECSKMHYKGTFKGTQLLCSYTHQFVPIELTKKALEAKSPTLYPDEKEAERIHEENAKRSEDHLKELRYILYDGCGGVCVDWDELQAFPEYCSKLKSICEFLPKDSRPIFLFDSSYVCSCHSCSHPHCLWDSLSLQSKSFYRFRLRSSAAESLYRNSLD